MRDDRTTMRFTRFARAGLTAALAGVATFGSVAVAQDATPDTGAGTEVVLRDVDDNEVGTVVVSEADGTVTMQIEVSGLEPGDHGIHIHQTGACDPSGDEPFASAGEHFNPTDAEHGPGPSDDGTASADAHAGDLGNITVGDDGTGTLEISTDAVTLEPGAENSLADADGSALLIHAEPDDLETDPGGDSGGRIACGVIAAPEAGTPTASPAASPAASGGAGSLDGPIEGLDTLRFAPDNFTVSPGDTIQLLNVGVLEHNFVVEELGIDVDMPNGEIVEVTIPEDVAPGEYAFVCTVPGHEEAGMVGIMTIE